VGYGLNGLVRARKGLFVLCASMNQCSALQNAQIDDFQRFGRICRKTTALLAFSDSFTFPKLNHTAQNTKKLLQKQKLDRGLRLVAKPLSEQISEHLAEHLCPNKIAEMWYISL
jgi:hypothetical protein